MFKKSIRLAGTLVSAALMLFVLAGCAAIQAEQQYDQGLTLYKQGHYTAAKQHVLRARATAPHVTRYESLLGWIYLKQGHLRKAEQLFAALSREHNGRLAALQGLAWVAYTQNQLPEARQWFQRQIQLASQYTQRSDWHAFSATDSQFILSCLSDGEYGLGLIALREKHYAAARRHFKKALGQRNDFMGHGPILAALEKTRR